MDTAREDTIFRHGVGHAVNDTSSRTTSSRTQRHDAVFKDTGFENTSSSSDHLTGSGWPLPAGSAGSGWS